MYSVKSITSAYCTPATDAPIRAITKRMRNHLLFFFGLDGEIGCGSGDSVGNSTSLDSGLEGESESRGGSNGGGGGISGSGVSSLG